MSDARTAIAAGTWPAFRDSVLGDAVAAS